MMLAHTPRTDIITRIISLSNRVAQEFPGANRNATASLLIGTALVESSGGKYIRQLGGGPARGLWQIEPDTANDIVNRYIRCEWRNEVREGLTRLLSIGLPMTCIERPCAGVGPVDMDSLMWRIECDDLLCCAIARLKYLPVNEPIPATLEGHAQYWKTYYNSGLGKGDAARYVRLWGQWFGETKVTQEIEA